LLISHWDKKAVECIWVYNVKYKFDGILQLYKARLFAKVFIQTYDVDYKKTFAPVTDKELFY